MQLSHFLKNNNRCRAGPIINAIVDVQSSDFFLNPVKPQIYSPPIILVISDFARLSSLLSLSLSLAKTAEPLLNPNTDHYLQIQNLDADMSVPPFGFYNPCSADVLF